MKRLVPYLLVFALIFALLFGFSSCGSKKNENKKPSSGSQTHKHEYKAAVTSPTCTEDGYTTYTCSCGKSYKANEVPALGHQTNPTKYQAPTCTEDGWSLGTTCTVCKMEFPVDTRIPALGHDYQTVEDVEATCTKDGVETVVCSTCENQVMRKTNATGHTITSYETVKVPTCNVDGKKVGHCDTCSEYVTIAIPATGHVAGEFIYEDDYCGEQKLGRTECTVCNEVILSFGHTYTTTIIEPTCTENGSKISTCTNCGDSYSEPIKSRGHIEDSWKISIPATCTTAGLEVLDCMICGEHIKTHTIDIRDHSYVSTTSANKITYTCSMCSDSYFIEAETYVTVDFVTVLDGINCPPTAIKYGAKTTLPRIEKDGYHFDGWFFDEEYQQECTADYIFEEDVTLYALWTVSRVEGSGSANNIITDAPVNFTFYVKSNKTLTNSNLKSYISIEDINGVSPKLYVSSVNNGVYTIASDEYKSGMSYEILAVNGVTIVGTDNNHLMFVTEDENASHIVYKDGVIFISEDKVFAAYESDDGKTYFLLRENKLSVGDVAVIHGATREDIYASMKVVSMGSSEGAYIYEVEPADFDDVFEECDIYFSGEIANDNFEFSSDLEDEIIEMVEASEIYAQMKYAAKQYANSVEIDNHKYEYIEMKVTPSFYKDKNNKLIVSVEITTYFNRTNKTTGKVDSILSITLKTKSVLKFGATANASSFDNFSLVLNVDNTTTVDLYVSTGANKENDKALKYFKEIFLKAKEDGAFKEIDKSSAAKSKELSLGTVSYTFNGVTFNIVVANVLDLDAVGQLGINSTFTMSVKAGVQCKNGNLSSVKAFDSNATFNFYTMGKARVENTLKLKASASFLGAANVYIDISSGPYFEVAGATTITLTSEGKYSSNISGYIEMGITVNASTGVNAKVEYWNFKKFSMQSKTLFDKSWNLYDEDFSLFDIGQKTISLHFYTENEEKTLDYICGSEVNIPVLIDKNMVQQNLETMEIIISEASCTYSLVTKSSHITISANGVLKVAAKAFETSDTLVVKIKVSYGEIFKVVTITLNNQHVVVIDAATEPTCTEPGLSEGSHCSVCKTVLVAQVETAEALGHCECEDCEVKYTVHPTETTDGYTVYGCCRCGVDFEGEYIDPFAPSEGLEFAHNGNGYTLTGIGTCTNSNVIIPSTYMGEPVTAIAEGAFAGLTNLESIAIPESITIIGNYAFDGCSGLTSVYIRDMVAWCGISFGNSYSSPFRYANNLYLIRYGEAELITELVIPSGITSISSALFMNCTSFTSVIIPEGVVSIDDYAFKGCRNLVTITIPESVTSIGEGAFQSCTALTSITIPNSVTSIGDYTFNGCSSLANVTIPTSVTRIGNYAFESCLSLASITIPNSVTTIGEGAFKLCMSLKNITLSNNITSISNYTFHGCAFLANITLPDNITSIGEGAFRSCGALTSITIPNSVTSIGISAFEGCVKLNSMTLPFVGATIGGAENTHFGYIFGASSYEDQNSFIPTSLKTVTITSVTSIGDYAFYGCQGLTSITIPDTATSIGNYAFYGCSGLASITIPNKVTTIGNYAFSGTRLSSIVIPDNVTSIGISAFKGCSKLKSITLPFVGAAKDGVDNTHFGYIFGASTYEDNNNFVPASLKTVIITTATSICDYAFYGCNGLTKVTLPDSVTSIGEGAFMGCSSLSNMTIPNKVVSIGNSAFQDCSSISNITLSTSLTTIGDNAFYGCSSLTNVTIPDSVTSIGIAAFGGCTSLYNITLPFVGATKDGSENTHFGYIFGASSYEENNSFVPASLKTVVITNATSIGNYAFYGCDGLRSVTIPDSATSIGNYAFYSCEALTSMTIPNKVASIGDYAFYGCTGLTSISIPNKVVSIGNSAFEGCSTLTNVTLSTSLTTIGDNAFKGCSSLTNVTIPDSTIAIGNSAFGGCSGLRSITLPFVGATKDGIDNTHFGYIFGAPSYIDNNSYVPAYLKTVTITSAINIGDCAFYRCNGIGIVTITSSINHIGIYAFEDCTNLTSITFLDKVTSIDMDAFYHCSNLSGVYITSIADWCEISFYDYDSNPLYYANNLYLINNATNNLITNLAIPSGVKNIGDYAFAGFSSLASVTLPNSVTSIGRGAFYGCSGITNITFPKVTTIGDYAFEYCSGLESLTIPVNVTVIGQGAFSGCSGIVSISLTYRLTTIGDGAFAYCSSLKSITVDNSSANYKSIDGNLYTHDGKTLVQYAIGKTNSTFSIPNTVTNIGYAAFAGCSSLTKITIHDNITDIGERAFYGCTGLTTAKIGDNVVNIGASAFEDCSKLKDLTIGKNVTNIDGSAFAGCSALTSVIIPDSVISIGGSAFSRCSDLRTVTISDSVTSIGYWAFSHCGDLITVNYSGTVEEWIAISEGTAWDSYTGNYTVYCADGNIANDGTVTMFETPDTE